MTGTIFKSRPERNRGLISLAKVTAREEQDIVKMPAKADPVPETKLEPVEVKVENSKMNEVGKAKQSIAKKASEKRQTSSKAAPKPAEIKAEKTETKQKYISRQDALNALEALNKEVLAKIEGNLILYKQDKVLTVGETYQRIRDLFVEDIQTSLMSVLNLGR